MRRLHLSAEQPFWLPALVEASKIGWWTRLQALFDCVNRYTELYTKAKQWEYHEGLEQIRPLAPRIFVQFHEHSRVYSAARLAVAELSPALWAQLPCEDDVLVGHMTPLEAAQAVRRVLAAMVDTGKPTAQQPAPSDNQAVPTKTRRGRPLKAGAEVRGGEELLIACLLRHHRYEDQSCLNYEPLGNNALAKQADVAPSTASAFFKRRFGGYKQYRAACRNKSLGHVLAVLSGDVDTRQLVRGGVRAADVEAKSDFD